MAKFETRESLILRLKNNQDDTSWEQFVVHYRPYICAVARNLGIAEDDIDDIAQQVTLKAWEKLPEFDYNRNFGRFKNWLAQVVRNIVMSYNRGLQREQNKLENFSQNLEEMQDSEFEELAERQWKLTIGEMAWENIKDRFSEDAVSCFELLNAGLKNKEIAARLNLKENTVAVFKKRIVSSLQKEILQLEASLS